jgi:hypothetical protein
MGLFNKKPKELTFCLKYRINSISKYLRDGMIKSQDYGFKIGTNKNGWTLKETHEECNEYGYWYHYHIINNGNKDVRVGNDELHFLFTQAKSDNYLTQIGK